MPDSICAVTMPGSSARPISAAGPYLLDTNTVGSSADLHHFADPGTEGQRKGNALRLACGQRLAPAGNLGEFFHHGNGQRILGHQLQPHVERVLPARLGDLVEETLVEETIERMTDRAPETDRDVHRGLDAGHPVIGNRVGLVEGAFGQQPLRPEDRQGREYPLADAFQDRRRRNAHIDGVGHAVHIHAGPEPPAAAGR
jgi:hypothetical protein